MLFASWLPASADESIGYGYQDDGTPAGATLYSVDLNTGIATQVGDLDRKTTGYFRLTNLVFAPNGDAYGYRDDRTPAGTSLYSVDVDAGIATLIGDLDRNPSSSFRLRNLVFAPNGNAYGYRDDGTPAGTSLYSVDVDNGVAMLIGDLDRNPSSSFRLRNLVFAPNGNAYGYRDDGTPAGTSLYSVNVSIGVATLIGNLDRKSSTSFSLDNLEFTADGKAYGYRDDGTPAGTSLYSVNVATGVATLIGDLDRQTASSFRLRNLVLADGIIGYGYRDDGTPAGTSLYSVNVTTGIASLIGNLDRQTASSFRLRNLVIPTPAPSLALVSSAVQNTVSTVTANDDRAITVEGEMVTIDVLANDDGLDAGPIDLMVSSDPTAGTAIITADNTVIYTPAAGFSGVDSFQYDAADRNGEASTATVTVTVAMSPGALALAKPAQVPTAPNPEALTEVTAADQSAAPGSQGSAVSPVSLLLFIIPWLRRRLGSR
jgi:hypothetical protein